MKKILTLIMISIKLIAFGQTKFDLAFLKQVLTTDKVEITTNDITNTFTDPPFWKLLGIYKDGEVTTPSINNGFWFGKDYLFLESSTLMKLYGSLVDQEIYEAIWHYDKQLKSLTIEFYDSKEIYKIITLNAVEIVMEDNSGTRFFYRLKQQFGTLLQSFKEKFKANH